MSADDLVALAEINDLSEQFVQRVVGGPGWKLLFSARKHRQAQLSSKKSFEPNSPPEHALRVKIDNAQTE